MVLNLAIGGGFFPPNLYGTLAAQDAANWGDPTFQIDYVRAYQWDTGASPGLPLSSTSLGKSTSSAIRSATSTPVSSAGASSATISSSVSSTTTSNPLEHSESLTSVESQGSTESYVSQEVADLGNDIAVDAQSKQSGEDIMGFPKAVVIGVGAGLGAFVVILVIIAYNIVVFKRRRMKNLEAQTDVINHL